MFKKLAAAFQSQPAQPAQAPKPKQTPQEIYLGLRRNILTLDGAQIGFVAKPGLTEAWGVVTDLGSENGWMTLVSLAEGTTSMYTSTGGGILGAGEDKTGTPAGASAGLVMVAGKYFQQMQLTKEFPLPAAPNVRFYVLTSGGVYTTEFKQLTPADTGHPFFELYAYAQNVVTELRLFSEKQNQKR
jgi:hypothetical protein